MNEKVVLPSVAMTEQQQSQTLQKMGLDFLSSIHWTIIIIVAVLFAGLLVFVKKRKEAEQERQSIENDIIIENSAQKLNEYYFLPNGELNPDAFPTPKRLQSNIERSSDANSTCEEFADDDINKRINNSLSPSILQQLRRFAKSGGLFSFLNSTMSAKDRLQQQLAKNIKKPTISEDQKIAMSLQSRFGGDQMRNPLINAQIRDEISRRREQNNETVSQIGFEERLGSSNLNQEQLSLLTSVLQKK